jgi:hypothetical protein
MQDAQRAALEADTKAMMRTLGEEPVEVRDLGLAPHLKISVRLEALLQPILNGDESLEEMETLVMMAAFAWNAGPAPGPDVASAREEIMKLAARLPPHELTPFLNKFELMLQQRHKLFHDDSRLVLNARVSRIPTGFYLSASTLGAAPK